MHVEELTLAENVGQVFQIGFRGTDATDTIRELIEEYHVGEMIYFSRRSCLYFCG